MATATKGAAEPARLAMEETGLHEDAGRAIQPVAVVLAATSITNPTSTIRFTAIVARS